MPSTSAASIPTDHEFAVKEEARFDNFYKDILSLHEILDQIQNFSLRHQFREIINKIEDDFVVDADFTVPRCSLYNTLRLGIIGGSLSGKSSLIQRFITGSNPKEDVMPGKNKKAITIKGQPHLLLIRDETGPPDYSFSTWADAVILVFSVNDELSFNVISSYYAKIVTHRNETTNILPIVLVAVKDANISIDGLHNTIPGDRIKKFIDDHQKCPFFEVSLETGENVNEVFQAAAEKILILQNLSLSMGYDHLLSTSFTSLNTIDGQHLSASTLSSSTNSLKKAKRRNTLFSLKGEKKDRDRDDSVYDDIGSGRSIPIKQGYLYKKNTGSIKEWKKKYVIITDNQSFSYYSSMKDYMENGSSKTFKLIHASVKVPGKRGSKLSHHCSTPQKAYSRSASSNNLLSTSPKSTPDELRPGKDCYVISNTSANNENADGSYLDSANGSPTIHDIPISRSASDSKDYAVATGLRNAQSYDAFPTKRKHRQGGRNKSCEIDYQPDNQEVGSDLDGVMFSPVGNIGRKKTHRRQKSNVAAKELGVGTDSEDVDYIFSLTYIDGRTWDFECSSMEERDSWITTIENQILKAFQLQQGNQSATTTSNGDVQHKAREKLTTIPGNDRCADCNTKDPEWTSLNLGVLICIECSGVHRNLGSHLSRVRSILLDDWPPESISVMLLLGNNVANSIWESRLPNSQKPEPGCSREERERWIARKYEKKEFLTPVVPSGLAQNLMSAVEEENVKECYKLLISSKESDVNKLCNVSTGTRMAPLHMSCFKANVPITQLLLWYRADPRIADDLNYNPIYYAHKSNSKDCADLLYQYGCPEDTPC